MNDFDMAEPTPADMAALVAEETLIARELDWLIAELNILAADERGPVDELDWRRVRRAEHQVIRETFAFVATRTTRTAQSHAA